MLQPIYDLNMPEVYASMVRVLIEDRDLDDAQQVGALLDKGRGSLRL